MKRMTITIFLIAATVSAFAQRTMRDFIITMPDSLVEYLNTTKRTEMVDFYDMGVKAETFNLLQGSTVLDSLTLDYADISLNEAARMQLALLNRQPADTVLCMVRTILGEAPESEVHFFNSQWKSLDGHDFLDDVVPAQLMQRPDTMTVERYDELVRLLDPVIVGAVMAPDHTISFSISTPMVTKEEKEQLKAILMLKRLNWNGQRFN